MNEEESAGGDETGKRRIYTLRKLCSNIEEYEALPCERPSNDLEHLTRKLEEAGFMDVVVQSPQLTVLMEDIGVVSRVHVGGTIHLQANPREDCEEACDILFALAMDASRAENHFE